MRYHETRERSAELLRLALSSIGQHEAAINPVTYTVWYEHVAGINVPLSNDLGELLQNDKDLDDCAIDHLYTQHIAPADTEALEIITGSIHKLVGGIAQSASVAGNQAGVFGAQLTDLSRVLAQQDPLELAPKIGELLTGTTQMKASVDVLQRKLVDSQAEVTRLKQDLERTRTEALVDPLTGVLNRKGFDIELKALLADKDSVGQPRCLVMLDIDHFKQVNDTRGHLVGDKVLRALGDVIRASLRGPDQAAARYGGEEFALLLKGASAAQGTQLTEAIRARSRHMRLRAKGADSIDLNVTVSAGLTEVRDDDDAATLVGRADAALYASKRNGRDRISVL